LRTVLAHLPSVAALSAAHLGALRLPEGLKRLYIACDNDRAGLDAGLALATRAISQGIAARLLVPDGKDFNDDLKSPWHCIAGAAAQATSLARRPGALSALVSGLVRKALGRDQEKRSSRKAGLSSRTVGGRVNGLLRVARRPEAKARRNGGPPLFSAAGSRPLCIAKQNSAGPPSSAVLRPPCGAGLALSSGKSSPEKAA
jgi:hypothetical protein